MNPGFALFGSNSWSLFCMSNLAMFMSFAYCLYVSNTCWHLFPECWSYVNSIVLRATCSHSVFPCASMIHVCLCVGSADFLNDGVFAPFHMFCSHSLNDLDRFSVTYCVFLISTIAFVFPVVLVNMNAACVCVFAKSVIHVGICGAKMLT